MSAMRLSVEIVVPVYNAADDVARCIDAVLAHTSGDYRLVVIDDASPDPRVGAWLRTLERARLGPRHRAAQRREPRLHGHREPRHDALARRRRAAQLRHHPYGRAGSTRSVAVRRATRRSARSRRSPTMPRSRRIRVLREQRRAVGRARRVDRARARGERRAELSGPADRRRVLPLRAPRADRRDRRRSTPPSAPATARRTIFCLRAVAAGFRNVLADDAYVLHTGGPLVRGPQDRARRAQPARAARAASALRGHGARLHRGRSAAAAARGGDAAAQRRCARAAGRAARDPRPRRRHRDPRARADRRFACAVAALPRHRGRRHVADRGASCRRRSGDERDSSAAPTSRGRRSSAGCAQRCASGLVHLHNISACRDGLLAAMPALDVPYGYTVHDLNFACPTITFLEAGRMYCGAQTDVGRCTPCLAAQPEFAGIAIQDWRARHAALVRHAAFVVAPSQWAADTFVRYFPDRRPSVIAHGHPHGGRRARADARAALAAARRRRADGRGARAPSGRTRARAGSSGWSRLRASRMRACASC